jgi:hypothetical protein
MIPILSILLALLSIMVCLLWWWLAALRAALADLRVRVEYLLREGGVGDEEERDE